MLLERLRLAEAQVDIGERHVAYMRQRLAVLSAEGSELAEQAARILSATLASQESSMGERDRLRSEIDALDVRLESQEPPRAPAHNSN